MDKEIKISEFETEKPGKVTGEFLFGKKEDEAFQIFNFYSNKDIPLDELSLKNRVSVSLAQNSCVEFVQFTCPVIDASRLKSATPEDYIVISPAGNNFESTSGRLAKLIKALRNVGIPSFINVILVDTDESDYIFPVLGVPPGVNNEMAEQRRIKYFGALTKNIKGTYAEWLTAETYRWSQIREEIPYIITTPDDADISEEVERLKELFGPQNYYDGLSVPTQEQLTEIAKLKFQTYAQQGYQLSRFFPNAVLLQNEFPLLLRTKMLNLLNMAGSEIPTIYPYGRSESRY